MSVIYFLNFGMVRTLITGTEDTNRQNSFDNERLFEFPIAQFKLKLRIVLMIVSVAKGQVFQQKLDLNK